MKYVPSLPPVVKGERDELDVYAMARVKAAKPVQARSLAPLVAPPHATPETSPYLDEPLERRRDRHAQGERRTYCRRVEHLPVLVELRSGLDRRHHTRRRGDVTDHVDEAV